MLFGQHYAAENAHGYLCDSETCRGGPASHPDQPAAPGGRFQPTGPGSPGKLWAACAFRWPGRRFGELLADEGLDQFETAAVLEGHAAQS